jgi:hypothetical protein
MGSDVSIGKTLDQLSFLIIKLYLHEIKTIFGFQSMNGAKKALKKILDTREHPLESQTPFKYHRNTLFKVKKMSGHLENFTMVNYW